MNHSHVLKYSEYFDEDIVMRPPNYRKKKKIFEKCRSTKKKHNPRVFLLILFPLEGKSQLFSISLARIRTKNRESLFLFRNLNEVRDFRKESSGLFSSLSVFHYYWKVKILYEQLLKVLHLISFLDAGGRLKLRW